MRRATDSRHQISVISVASALAMGLFLVCPVRTAAAPNPFDVQVAPVEIGQHLPPITLHDQHGRELTFDDLRGNTAVVGFVYTRCTDACPIITQKFGRLHDILGDSQYRLVEVTIDPAHDTVPALASYAVRYKVRSRNWQLVTGSPAALTKFVRAAGVSVIENGRGELVHNAKLLLISPDGRVADVVDLVTWDPETVAAQMRHIAGDTSNPIARLNYALTKTVAQLCGGSYSLASGIIDVVAALVVIVGGVTILWWLRRRIFAQGA